MGVRSGPTNKSPATGGAKVDGVRHLASTFHNSQEPKVFCLTPDSIRNFSVNPPSGVCVDTVLLHRHRSLPQSSSASRFTAGASAFFILSQSGERPER